MNNSQRVYITGYSALTATGSTVDDNWSAILSGKTGIDEIKQWDLSSWTHRLGGEIKDFQPAKMIPDRKLLKVISKQDVLGLNASIQAVEHSQLMVYRDTLSDVEAFNEDTAIFVGSPGNKYLQQYDFLPLLDKSGHDMKAFGQHLFEEIHPMWLLRILPNNVLAYTGITYGFKGYNHNITNHAVSGTQALIEAFHAVKNGQAERAVVIAYDIGTEPQALYYYEKLGLLSASQLKPFDQSHDGTILAEGASALILESESSVAARQAKCYGEIVAGFSQTESQGLFSIEAEGAALADLMTTCFDEDRNPIEVGMVVAHGNGNEKSDVSEAQAIGKVFGNHAVPVTAFKWSMGHTLCASGILDTVLATYALNKQCIPGIAVLDQVAPSCQHLNLSQDTRRWDVQQKPYALIISRGFASMNACVMIKACG